MSLLEQIKKSLLGRKLIPVTESVIKNPSHKDAVAALKEGKSVVYDAYHNGKDMKAILEKIKTEVPEAWVTRSPSTNNWTVFPK